MMRFHVIGLPHTLATKDYLHCAYSQKVRLFVEMMRSLNHEVFLYESDEPWDPAKNLEFPFKENDPVWIRQNARAIAAMRERIEPRDFICLIAGRCQRLIAEAFPSNLSVEYGVGYSGIFAAYCVFESYAHMHNVYGQLHMAQGRMFDAVIPNYFDPDDFPVAPKRDDYLLFIGRLNADKGLEIAVETARRTNRRLVVCGQGEPPKGDRIEYRGLVGVAERGELMSQAHAVLVPTLYLEPFGGVAVEAQLCGTPVITTDFGAFPETVVDGVTGYRCRTAREFAAAVGRVGNLDPMVIWRRAIERYSKDRVRFDYQHYFDRLNLLWEGGWYA